MENLNFHFERLLRGFYDLFQGFRNAFTDGAFPKPVVAPVTAKHNLQSVVHASTVANITGYKLGTAQKMLCRVRRRFNKPLRSLVTVQEFSAFTSIPPEDIYRHL
jgi:hypothetical protein